MIDPACSESGSPDAIVEADGNPKDGPGPLDITCSRLGDDNRIRFTVTSCTGYSDKTLPSLYHMEDIAWILRSDSKRKQLGFVRSRDLKFEDRHRLTDDD